MRWFLAPWIVLMLATGYLNGQGGSMLVVAGFFGLTDGVQEFMEANPANPHPAAKLPSE